jgi:hypothetical protein
LNKKEEFKDEIGHIWSCSDEEKDAKSMGSTGLNFNTTSLKSLQRISTFKGSRPSVPLSSGLNMIDFGGHHHP